MKGIKFWLIVGTLVVVTALIARYLGHLRGEREVLAEDAREQELIRDRHRPLADAIARYVTASEEIAVVTTLAGADEKQVVTFRDDEWRTKLAALIAEAPCAPAPRSLWVSSPYLEFGSPAKDAKKTTFMWNGSVLRVNAKSISGDFFVGAAVTAELSAWVKAKTAPASAPAPTPTPVPAPTNE